MAGWDDFISGLGSLFSGGDAVAAGSEAVDFIDPDLLALAQADPSLAFDLADLGDLSELGFGVGENLGDFGLTAGSDQTVGEASSALGSGLARFFASGATSRTAADVARSLANLTEGTSTGGFQLPSIRLEESPSTPTIGLPPKTDMPPAPPVEPFKPLAMESPTQRPEVGLDRLMAQQRGDQGGYLPESRTRLWGQQQRRGGV